MNLIEGKIVTSASERDAALSALDGELRHTLSETILTPETVLSACDALSRMIGEEHLSLLVAAGIPTGQAAQYLQEAQRQLRRESLQERLKWELGEAEFQERAFVSDGIRVRERIAPLGVLLHIVAGNQHALAFYSVLEGLLTGNINLVKLPGSDDGLSVWLLSELAKLEPALNRYLYVFDYPSENTAALQKLMELANAVVVWGGDATVRAVRASAPANTRIIEWGHRLSFAYVTPQGIRPELLQGLADNIAATDQLLCSSCQGIYVDTDSMEILHRFCESFLPVLERRFCDNGHPVTLQAAARTGLLVYTEQLKSHLQPCRVFQGDQTSLIAYEDRALAPSFLYGNCWVKRLPRDSIVTALSPHKGHLQTVGLLCAENETSLLTERLWRSGVMRVTRGKNMSESYRYAAHDGEYPLRRYTRIVSEEIPEN